MANSLLTSVLFGLVGMFGWGIADFLARDAISKIGDLNTLLWSQLIGFLALFGFAFVSPSYFIIDQADFLIFLITGFLWTFAYLAFYRALGVGKLSVVSPIGSAWGAISACLGFFILGEALPTLGYAGIVFAFFGITLVSVRFSDLKSGVKLDEGVVFAFLAMLGWGILFFLFKFASSSGVAVPMILKGVAVLFLIPVFAYVGRRPRLNKSAILSVLGVGLLDDLAFVSVVYGISKGLVSVVAPISSAFPAVTVSLAFVILRERLELNQWVGLILILLAIISLSI